MFRLLAYLFFAYVLTFDLSAQRQRMVRTIKPVKTHPAKTNLGIGVGITNSAIFLQRNTLEDGNIKGLTGTLTYDASKKIRINIDYTRYQKIDIVPTWYDIHASTLEANMSILWYSKGGLCFYPMAGLSYNVFKGNFTGLDDFQNLAAKYPGQRYITTRWLGFNAGVGMEYIIKPFAIFGNAKMRVGFSDGNSQLNIMDVCFNAGIRYNLRAPSLYKLFKRPGDRYSLDSDK